MITRVWRGWTASAGDADAYETLLRDEILPGLEQIAGFAGATVLRRDGGTEGVEFVVMTLFDTLAAIHGFAGDDLERAVIEPAARRLLAHADERVTHYETVIG